MSLDPEHRRSCTSCQAAIVFAKMPTGALMPVDFEPSEGANVVLFDGPEGLMGVVVNGRAMAHKPRHRSHFATCPNADEHRRKRAIADEERCAGRKIASFTSQGVMSFDADGKVRP